MIGKPKNLCYAPMQRKEVLVNHSQPNQVTLADYQALVRRVENLERIVREQLASVGEAEYEKKEVSSKNVTDTQSLIQELQDEYTKYPSFTQALLADRAAEREREESKLRSGRVRTVRAASKRKGRSNRHRASHARRT